MSITTTIACQQADKGQDHIVKTDKAITVFDGHGYNDVIKICRQMDPLLFEAEPNKYIANLEQKLSKIDSSNSGSTFAGVRVYTNSFGQLIADLYWIGDSNIAVYDSHGLCLFKTNTAKNLDPEVEIVQITDALNMSIEGEKEIRMKTDHYWHFPKGEVMNMTEALGHQNVAYYGMHHHQIPLSSKFLKIVLATDGFWDITCQNDKPFMVDPKNEANEFLKFALRRWSQEWNYDPNSPGEDKYLIEKTVIPYNQRDDIAIGVININPLTF